MKINNLKINGFGKIENKEINLKDGINIIYGENESGKSTILKFITSMFFGLTKNKNGGTIPENEKYTPWKAEEFSGKISYELDNNESFEVFRDFNKKNPKIFNKNLEDISKQFNIDKTKGNEFFYEQIGIEEDIFISSVITKQSEVILNEKEQNALIQKISNTLGTGEDNISYLNIVGKLKKKLNDEVGSANTKERPINIIESRINSLNIEKNELNEYQANKFYTDSKINSLKEEIKIKQKELENLRKANIEKEKTKDYQNKISINKEILNNIQYEINENINNKEKYIIEENKKISLSNIFIIIAIIALVIISLTIFKIAILKIISPILLILYIAYILLKLNKKKNENHNIKLKHKELENKIEVLKKNKENKCIEIENLEREYNNKLAQIKKEYNVLNLDNLIEEIDNKQAEINSESLKLHTIEIDYNNIILKLEKLVNIEEELDNLKEEKKELEQKRNNIKRTLEYLEIAYNKMKEQITPKFTEELSKAIEEISDEKYKKVQVNTEGRIIVETDSGEYIDAENLSIGTIDQLYLSLRISATKEITKENMPLILDEAFAYYDEKRLENILKYLSKKYKEKQTIIFTCTKREIESLSRMNMKYNLIEL